LANYSTAKLTTVKANPPAAFYSSWIGCLDLNMPVFGGTDRDRVRKTGIWWCSISKDCLRGSSVAPILENLLPALQAALPKQISGKGVIRCPTIQGNVPRTAHSRGEARAC